MALWTREELSELDLENWAGVFRFASLDFGSLFELALFDKSVWYRLDSPAPLTLLTP
jgi:hypothetical protein